MPILTDLLVVFAQMVQMIIGVYIFIVIARALISWVGPDPYNPIVRFLYSATEPVLNRLRRLLPMQFGGIDFSPLALLFILYFIQRLVSRLLWRLG
ncbi:MAG: YggT family protein [Syntrophotaleaceae bacterium]